MTNLKHEVIVGHDVEKIIGHVPNFITRFGILLLFGLLLVVAASSYLIRYPTIVSAPINLYTEHPPIALIAASAGKIKELFVIEGQNVSQGQLIGKIGDNADLASVELLEKQISRIGGLTGQQITWQNFSNPKALGDLQPDYFKFVSAVRNLNDHLRFRANEKRRANQKRLLKLREDLLTSQSQGVLLKNQEFAIAREMFRRDSTFYLQNKYGIPMRDYEISRQNFLKAQEEYLQFLSNIKSFQVETNQIEGRILDIEIDEIEKIRILVQGVEDFKDVLQTRIRIWKDAYLLYTPIRGRVTFTKFWSENQNVKIGERLATVTPDANQTIIAKGVVPNGSGFITVGQKVNIKLTGFPHLKHGLLKGFVKSISLVPEDGNYFIEINLADAMKSSTFENLVFTQEMSGVAEIISDDKPLLYQILAPFRALFQSK